MIPQATPLYAVAFNAKGDGEPAHNDLYQVVGWLPDGDPEDGLYAPVLVELAYGHVGGLRAGVETGSFSTRTTLFPSLELALGAYASVPVEGDPDARRMFLRPSTAPTVGAR
jgi:hypothetical protein